METQQQHRLLNRMRHEYREHPIRWHVRFAALMMVGTFLVVTGIGVVHKAAASETPVMQRSCTHNPDGTCRWSPKKMTRMFKQGYFHKAHGTSKRWMTKKTKHYVIKKTTHHLKNMSHKRFEAIRAHQNAITHFHNGKAAERGGYEDQQRRYCEAGSYLCVSRMSWEDVQARAKCVGVGYYTTHRDTCDWGGRHPQPPNGPITLQQWKAIGAFTFCAGGVIGGLMAEAPSGGASTFVVINAASSCAFGWWAANAG